MFDEPKDMFEGVEAAPQPPTIQPPAGTAFNPPPSAVNVISDEHVKLASEAAAQAKTSNKGVLFAAGLVGVVAVVGGVVGFWYYQQATSTEVAPVADQIKTGNDGLSDSPTVPLAPVAPVAPAAPVTPPVVPVPQVLDSDGDGLTDARETEIGTSIVNNDTDGDALGDREEVDVYGTDPLRPDTDGDTFTDGSEVSNGYNPNGPGKILEIPRTP